MGWSFFSILWYVKSPKMSHTALDIYPDRFVVTKDDVIVTQIDQSGQFADYPIVDNSFTYGSNPSFQGFPAHIPMSNHLLRLGKLRMLVFDTINCARSPSDMPSAAQVIFNSKIPAEDRPAQSISSVVQVIMGGGMYLACADLDVNGAISLRYLDPDGKFVGSWKAEATIIPSFTLTWTVNW
jgi:hypothetical protein